MTKMGTSGHLPLCVRGRWEYHSQTQSIVCTTQLGSHNPKHLLYEIDLNTCVSAAEILDWILQVSTKSWATATDMSTLVWMFAELVGGARGLQGLACPSGEATTFTYLDHIEPEYRQAGQWVEADDNGSQEPNEDPPV